MTKIKLFKTTFFLFFLSSNLLAFNAVEELRGDWWVSHYDKEKEISFLNLKAQEIHLNFIGQKKVLSNTGNLKELGFEFSDNNLIFGNVYKDKIKYSKFVYKLYPQKEYINNQICYRIKPTKISAGYYNKKDSFKICREEREYRR